MAGNGQSESLENPAFRTNHHHSLFAATSSREGASGKAKERGRGRMERQTVKEIDGEGDTPGRRESCDSPVG